MTFPKQVYIQFQSPMISNSKLINACFDLSAQRFMVKLTQSQTSPSRSSLAKSLIVLLQSTHTLQKFHLGVSCSTGRGPGYRKGLHFQQKFPNRSQNFGKNSRTGITKAFSRTGQIYPTGPLLVKNSDLKHTFIIDSSRTGMSFCKYFSRTGSK